MRIFNRSGGMIFLYSFFNALVAFFSIGGMLVSPSEPGNSILFGLSLPRVLLAIVFLFAFLFFTSLSLKSLRDHEWAERSSERWFGRNPLGRVVLIVAGVSLGLGWIGCFLPFYRAGMLAVHWARLRPAMIFILLVSISTLISIFFKRSKFISQDLKFSKTLRLGLVLFFLSVLVIGLMLYSGFGVSAAEDYWYGAGVPILASQFLVAVAAGLLFFQFEKKWPFRRMDLLLFLVIYAVTAFLWAREPLEKSFLFIGPYAPNRVLYPFADSALFDTASQFALIGQRFLFYNGLFFERALYVSFLVYLHAIVGQDYGQLMMAQAVVFAVFPALVYLVGRSLNSRAVGFGAALIAMLRGANAIAASNMIDMANPKMMLTDFPTAIGMVLIVLFMIEWLKSPQQKWYYAVWIGGILGMTIMLRTNTLMLLVLIPFYAILRFWPDWKKWVLSSIILFAAVFAVSLPWELRNQSLGGHLYSSIVDKFRNVIQQRYTPPSDPSSFSPQPDLGFVTFKQLQVFNALYQEPAQQIQKPCDRVACFVPNHFLHNILTSILILPTSPVLDDLRHTVKESLPYWDPKWDGTFTFSSLLVLALNLFFIALGISLAWRQWNLIGITPLVMFMFYDLSNGFARTSGGRYVVPIDWIVTIYFLIGLFQVVLVCANALGSQWSLFSAPLGSKSVKDNSKENAWPRVAVALVLFFGFGALIPLSEKLYANHFGNFNVSKSLADHEAQITNAGLSLGEINAFLQTPNAELSFGRTLYPRYYIENEGEVHFYPVIKMGFPRITFTLIGPKGEQGVVLPGRKPRYFPHGADVIVLGCREQFYVDALAVIILDDKGAIYTRSPESSLQCPLKQPVCDNNHHCQ